jgi:hypothetical protein
MSTDRVPLRTVVVTFAKPTPNTYRWDAPLQKTKFEIYIERWCVPGVPDGTRFRISIFEHAISDIESPRDKTLADGPLVEIVRYSHDVDHYEVYFPTHVDNKSWRIRPLYIPFELDLPHHERLLIRVEAYRPSTPPVS